MAFPPEIGHHSPRRYIRLRYIYTKSRTGMYTTRKRRKIEEEWNSSSHQNHEDFFLEEGANHDRIFLAANLVPRVQADPLGFLGGLPYG